MRILLTGATGYIGKRLIPVLLESGHELICCVRDLKRFNAALYPEGLLTAIEVDFLNESSMEVIPDDIDAAYYLIHSMSTGASDFEKQEELSAMNFVERINRTRARQVIYLSGIVNESQLSKHLSSRFRVEQILASGSFSLTTLRTGIIIGSGSASFEIMRDLVEKLPFMIAPRWLNTRSQPIAIRNVLQFLRGVLDFSDAFNQSFDIGGPEILTYRDMLLIFAEVRHLKRKIITLPVMSPRLSSYWLYFITTTSYSLAVKLVDSMKVEVVCRPNLLAQKLGIELLPYRQAVQLAFDRIKQQDVVSSWIDAQASQALSKGIRRLIEVPEFGCYKDQRSIKIDDEDKVLEKIWQIGGQTGWYYANWLWSVRGTLDKLAGGVGLRRGRKNPQDISPGDSLDFWRVLLADKQEKRLLLYAEMKLPGEAWLEFRISNNRLYQTATFRPLGISGRAYWLSVIPFHTIIFGGMLRRIARG